MAGDDLIDGKFRPQWQGAVVGYARKFAKANHWRVRLVCDEPEDTFQQCAVVFAYLSKIYGDKIDDPALFQELYQRSLHNAFISLARTNQRRARVIMALEQLAPVPDIEPPSAPLLTALTEASTELRQVLEVIYSAPTELLQLLLPDRPPRAVHDQHTLSRTWCRIARTSEVRDDLLDELRMRLT